MAHTFTKPDGWGEWHEGNAFDVRLGAVHNYDQGGYHTRVEVQIREHKTGVTHFRVGDGKQIGNFHPIWVRVRSILPGQTEPIQVETLLRVYLCPECGRKQEYPATPCGKCIERKQSA